MRRSQVFGAALALVVLGGAGVAALSPTGRATDRKSVASETGPLAAASADQAGGGAGTVAGKDAFAEPSQPRVVKTAALTVSVAKAALVATATRDANSIVERRGGFVANTETRTGEDASSSLTLRVPVAAYDATLTELRRLGKVSNETLGGQDVTNTLVDLDARLRSLRAQETALNGLMAKANTVGETLQVAQAVADVRTQIEQLAAQQKNLSNQADFATITLSVVGPRGASSAPKPDPLLVTAVERAVGGSLAVLGGAIVVIGYVLPAGLLAAAGYGVVRLRRRRVAAVA